MGYGPPKGGFGYGPPKGGFKGPPMGGFKGPPPPAMGGGPAYGMSFPPSRHQGGGGCKFFFSHPLVVFRSICCCCTSFLIDVHQHSTTPIPGIKLRGLPFEATESDVVDFLGNDCTGVSEADVLMERGRKGYSKGIAFVNIPGQHDQVAWKCSKSEREWVDFVIPRRILSRTNIPKLLKRHVCRITHNIYFTTTQCCT